MSSTINIYESDAQDFDCEGLGTLCPLDWEYTNKGAGGAVLTMTHPYDGDGRWRLLQAGRIIRADVPVRTVPEIEGGAMIATAERWTVARTATAEQRRMYTRAVDGRALKVLPKNTRVTVVRKGAERYKIKASRYGTGWIDPEGLDVKIVDVPYGTVADVEAETPSVQVRAQLFRLQQPRAGEARIEVDAMPVAYDAAGVLTDPYAVGVKTGQQVLDLIATKSYAAHDVELYTDIGDRRTGFDKRNVGVFDALLNGEDSFVGRFGGEVLLDNWSVTILRQAGVDRGFYATYGRNLTGVDSCEVDDDVVTALLPVGENANGTPLYLSGEKIMRAENYDQFPVPKMAELKVSEAKVSEKEGVSVALARARMREAVQAEWARGAHIPAITLRITFALLGDSEEYKAFKDIDQCHIYDIVHVWHPTVCGYVDLAVCECTWNGAKGRYTSMTLGAPGGALSTARISAGAISGSITGRQIAWNTVGAGQLANDCIDVRHVQAGVVTAEKLAAGAVDAQSIAAVTAAINAITAQDIATGTLSAAFAHLFQVVADNIDAGSVTTGALDAVMAGIVALTAKVGDFDLATVTNLVASALTLKSGLAGSMMIANLAVTSANLLNATISKLVLLGEDGKYYEVGVGGDGIVHAAEYAPTQAEIDAGQTADGRQIVAQQTIVAEEINGAAVRAVSGVFDDILTAALTAGQITAQDALLASATIPALYTTSINAIGSTMDISANETILLKTGDDTRGLRRILRLDSDGVHVGDSATANELLLDSQSVNVRMGGQTFSKFAGNYVQFGDYQLRRTTDGGLVFKRRG